MLTKATSQDIASYAGELRKVGDEREAQVLKDYDAAYKMLKDKGVECGLQLPPLFEKEFVDHGALTSQNKNSEDIRNHLNIVLNFLERSNMFDLLLPASRDSKGQGGYKVNSNDPRFPPDIKTALNKCTETFSTTVGHKAVRLRFLDCQKLDPVLAKQLEVKVSASHHCYESWVVKYVNQIMRDRKIFGKSFVASFLGSSGQKR
jgi:hypothetical protein